MPSTRTRPAAGPGSAIRTRIRVWRLTCTASTARASRDPARPASAAATAPSCPASSGVARAYGTASPSRLLREARPRAFRIAAPQQPHHQPDQHPAAARGSITQPPRIPVTHRRAPGPATRARRPARRRMHPDPHQAPADLGPVHRHPGKARQQQAPAPAPAELTTTRRPATLTRRGSLGSGRFDTAGLPGAPPRRQHATPQNTPQPHSRYPAAAIQKYATEPDLPGETPAARAWRTCQAQGTVGVPIAAGAVILTSQKRRASSPLRSSHRCRCPRPWASRSASPVARRASACRVGSLTSALTGLAMIASSYAREGARPSKPERGNGLVRPGTPTATASRRP